MYPNCRYHMILISGLLLFSTGCFLPFIGGGDDESSTLEGDLVNSEAMMATQNAVASALEEVDLALEDGRYEAAVINYHRAIQADSTNIDIYLELASLHQQLALQKRDDGDIEGALQENNRALKVLSTMVGKQLKPAAEQGIDLSTLSGFQDSADEMDMLLEDDEAMEDAPPEEEP